MSDHDFPVLTHHEFGARREDTTVYLDGFGPCTKCGRLGPKTMLEDTGTCSETFTPRCVRRTGRECRDCVECLSAIPGGKTCATCVHATACKTMWGVRDPESTHYCQWVPSRYSPRAVS